MRVGVMGLGDIAQKAYLPIMAGMEGVDWVLCTRNTSVLEGVKARYRITEGVQTLDELIGKGVNAVFVHTATESHPAVIEPLLNAGIHVYVDKPIAYAYEETLRLTELAREKGCVLMTGFNRRYSPMVSELTSVKERSYIYMEKNRVRHPDYARRFIFDDFIHVADTLSFLSPGQIRDVSVSALVKDGLLYQVLLKLEGQGFTSIGLMNRDSGLTEERLEVIGTGQKSDGPRPEFDDPPCAGGRKAAQIRGLGARPEASGV
ncbi:Gfo/Idh/MocA family protein [Paenibacillus sp. DMB20]|uniref:Gfo/Idh/MocA family protein n=1 Tax=Paenibacillus sp. DMB20 TaxID=1642570 RepID=UPI000A7BBAAA|nr:Gfo/Idh/MocA family oxidoreductase [Paenibacillus sp. DMB20]